MGERLSSETKLSLVSVFVLILLMVLPLGIIKYFNNKQADKCAADCELDGRIGDMMQAGDASYECFCLDEEGRQYRPVKARKDQ